MKVGVFDHHGKAQMLVETLAADPRFQLQQNLSDCELVLADSDHPQAPPIGKHDALHAAAKRGVKIVLYPHGANLILDYDGLDLADCTMPICCHLVHAEGHAEVYRRIGYPRRVEVIGFSYCETSPPVAPSKPVSQLLFAPMHPWADGKMILPANRELNEAGYEAFLDYPAERKRVRVAFGHDEPNGIKHPRRDVEYVTAADHPVVEDVDWADAVISQATFAHIALARGKPTVMLDPYPNGLNDQGTQRATHFDEYAGYARYPAGLQDGPLDELFGKDVEEWKQLFVGGPFQKQRFLELLLSL